MFHKKGDHDEQINHLTHQFNKELPFDAMVDLLAREFNKLYLEYKSARRKDVLTSAFGEKSFTTYLVYLNDWNTDPSKDHYALTIYLLLKYIIAQTPAGDKLDELLNKAVPLTTVDDQKSSSEKSVTFAQVLRNGALKIPNSYQDKADTAAKNSEDASVKLQGENPALKNIFKRLKEYQATLVKTDNATPKPKAAPTPAPQAKSAHH